MAKKKAENQEIAIYVEGGIVQNVSIVNKTTAPEKWGPAKYSVIDFDIEGADSNDICFGCLYSTDPHFADYCQREKRKGAKNAN